MNPLENPDELKSIIEAALMAADEPLTVRRITQLFLDEKSGVAGTSDSVQSNMSDNSEEASDSSAEGDADPDTNTDADPENNNIDPINSKKVKEAIAQLQEAYAEKSLELIELASGFTFRIKKEYAPWISKLWESKPPRYSRASLETLALIAYKQPITRAEIEEVRGVSVSSHIIKTLLEREWIKIIGHRDIPGRPALFATTKDFLDHFNLKRLDELPLLPAIEDMEKELEKKSEQLEINLQIEIATADDKTSYPDQS